MALRIKLFLGLVIVASILSTAWLSLASCHNGSCNETEDFSVPSDHMKQNVLSASSIKRWTPTTANRTVFHKPRILLGISSVLDIPTERQRRHLIRNTYLDFDRLHLPNQPNRVCSLPKFLQQPTEECQLVYTFILNAPNATVRSDIAWQPPIDRTLIDNHETDVLYLDIPQADKLWKLWNWFHYASSIENIDYIVYTDTQLAILPATFWENELFQTSPEARVYGGIQTPKSTCLDTKCPSLQPDYVMRRFVLLSRDLVAEITKLSSNELPNLLVKESADVAVANVLHKLIGVRNVSVQGLIPKTTSKGLVGDFLNVWDRHKDSLVDYQDGEEINLVEGSQGSRGGALPRLLLGIFTMDCDLERERRDMIRQTYLQAFAKTDTPHRLCRLEELNSLENPLDCQLAYTFVMGGNSRSGPTELIHYNESYPLTIDKSMLPGEPDVVYLNIRENMKEGKSQTWLNYALTVLGRHYFDYIGKADTDTLLFPQDFLTIVIGQLPKFPNNMRMYGGDYRIRPSTPTFNLGPAYMGGHLYFLSPDLARYIVSPKCDRSALAVFSEDQSIGNFIHSHPKPIRRVRMRTDVFEHPVKRIDRFKTLWRKHIGKYKKKPQRMET